MKSITIYHSSDLHGNLEALTRICAHLRGVRRKGGEFLYFDCGDLFGAAEIGNGMARAMDEAGLTAMVLGNHEADIPPEVLSRALFCGNFLVLGGNVNIGNAVTVQGALTHKANGLTVDVIGVAAEALAYSQKEASTRGWSWGDGFEYLESLALDPAKARVRVLLSHMGLSRDMEAACMFPWVDAILGGHSHDTLEGPEMCCGKPVFHVGGYGQHLGKIELSFGTDGISWDSRLLKVEELPAEDVDIEFIWTILGSAEGSKGRALLIFDRQVKGPKFAPNLFGRLAAASAARITGSDMAFVNATAINPAFTGRYLTTSDIRGLLSFNDRLMTARADASVVATIERAMTGDHYYFLHKYPRACDSDGQIDITVTEYLTKGGMHEGTVFSFLRDLDFKPTGATIASSLETFVTSRKEETIEILNEWPEFGARLVES